MSDCERISPTMTLTSRLVRAFKFCSEPFLHRLSMPKISNFKLRLSNSLEMHYPNPQMQLLKSYAYLCMAIQILLRGFE